MAVSPSYREFLLDLLNPIGPINIRRMFGGAGIFADGLMFALIADDMLYLKVDGQTQPRFEMEGMAAFSYQTKAGRRGVMSYWTCPDRLFDDPDELHEWAREAIAVAQRTDAKKPKSKRKTRPEQA